MNKLNPNISYPRKPDEISVRNLIMKVREHVIVLLSRWYLLLFAALPGGIYQYYTISQIKPTFPGKIVFLVRPQDIAKENKITVQIYSRLAHSRNLIEEVLLEGEEEFGTGTLIINRYLEAYYQHQPEGLADTIHSGFQFDHDQQEAFTNQEKIVFKEVMEKVTTPEMDFSDGFISISVDEVLGFITINSSTPTEELTFLLINRLREKLARLIFENTIYSEKLAYNELATETDSLANGYRKTYYGLHKARTIYQRYLDTKSDPYSGKISYWHKKIIRLEVRADIFKMDYLSSLEQLKAAQVEMNVKSPLIVETEKTLSPIEPYLPSAKRAAAKGSIAGIALVVFFIFLRKVFNDIVNEL